MATKHTFGGVELTQRRMQLIENFEQAVRADQFKGSQPPDDWDDIETELQRAKQALINSVGNLEARARKTK